MLTIKDTISAYRFFFAFAGSKIRLPQTPHSKAFPKSNPIPVNLLTLSRIS
jgi:hypothetical protein